jgi:enoyl-CoA hydratase/carnithine racemase
MNATVSNETRPAKYEKLQVENRDSGLLVVTLNRPDEGNALNTQMCIDLLDLWTGLLRDGGGVRCVIVTGAGGRAFCAGGDMKQRKGMTDAAWRHQHEIAEQAFWTMMECPVPVIAAVNGDAYGGGLEMILAADFAYGVDSARFGFPEVKIGIIPGVGGTTTLPRIVGERRANEIIFSGAPFGAAEALGWGILNRVCSAAELLPAATAMAEGIPANAPLAVRQAKKAIHEGMQMDVRAALRFEVEAYNRLVDTEDRLEGVLAWNERRKPVFKGR